MRGACSRVTQAVFHCKLHTRQVCHHILALSVAQEPAKFLGKFSHLVSKTALIRFV